MVSAQLATQPHAATCSFLHQLDGERTERVKGRKLVGWDKDKLIGKLKAVHTSRAKQGIIHCFPRAGRSSVMSRRAGLHQTQQLPGKTNTQTLNIPLSSFFLPALHVECDARCGISHWSVETSCPCCVSSQLLVSPQLPHWQGGTRTRKGLGSLQALLTNNYNIPILSSLFPAQFQDTAPCQLLWRKLPLSQRKQIRGLSDWFIYKVFWTLPNVTPWFECHSCLTVFCS